MLNVLLLVWLLFGLIVAEVNKRKAGGWFAGLLLGVCIGPLGLLLSLVMPYKPNYKTLTDTLAKWGREHYQRRQGSRWSVYRIQFADGTAYVGMTGGPVRKRVARHLSGTGSPGVRARAVAGIPHKSAVLASGLTEREAREVEHAEIAKLGQPLNRTGPGIDRPSLAEWGREHYQGRQAGRRPLLIEAGVILDGEPVRRGPLTARDRADRARLGLAVLLVVLGVVLVLGALAVV